MDNNTGVNWSSSTVTMEGLHKSAIIYRKNSACFIYVCYHCGNMFDEVTETLQHIESHFQLANVVIGQLAEDEKGENLGDCFAVTRTNSVMEPFAEDSKDDNLGGDCFAITSVNSTVDIKVEAMDHSDGDGESLLKSEPQANQVRREFRCKICNSIESSKFSIRIHALIQHIREPMKCTHCNSTTFQRLDDFENHLRAHIAEGEVNWKSVTDGIQSTVDVDWSAYYEAMLRQDNKIKEEIARTSESPHELTIAKRPRRKQTRRRVYSRPYRCHKCSQTCRYMNALRSHYNTHVDEDLLRAYRCKECDCYYKNAYSLRVHVLDTHRMVKRLSCKGCALEFNCSHEKQFEEHLQLHNGSDKKLWPDIRDGIDHVQEDFTQYEETTSFADEEHCCEFCTQRFYLKSNFDVHMTSVHSGQRRLQCGQCDAIFTTPKFYFAHQLEHQRVGATIVERDDNVLLANLDACIDERIIYDEDELNQRLYRCLICNTAFDIHYDIRSHIRERHVYKMFPPPVEPKKEFICDLCGMRLKTKAAVKNHLLIHTNTKKHPCTICGKMFRQNSDRRIHERQHTGEKPFQCHLCGKAFISNGLLTAHKKSHDDTTYPCPICGRVFNLPSGYRKHIQTHRQDRSFKCTVCPKSFNTKIYLSKHMSIHSDKQYQCRFCDSKFSTSDGQRQHQRHKHKYASNLS
ncbi:hypothetical protein HA402_005015 [Bradysia odoriphaga]|nr:hypothetical protein HA402_005015 [Bradysia odoriphaga]